MRFDDTSNVVLFLGGTMYAGSQSNKETLQ